jgi:hypothetical protein
LVQIEEESYIHIDSSLPPSTDYRGHLSDVDLMSDPDHSLEDLKEASMEDAWYELEGAYEVYSVGRCRFVMIHCRTALLIGIALLARKKGIPSSRNGVEVVAKCLDMPGNLIGAFMDVVLAGSYPMLLEKHEDEQQYTASILSKALEVFEWIRKEMYEVRFDN